MIWQRWLSSTEHRTLRRHHGTFAQLTSAIPSAVGTSTFSATNPKADIWADDISSEYGLVSFRAHTPTWTGHLSIPMPGLFNVDNARCYHSCQLAWIFWRSSSTLCSIRTCPPDGAYHPKIARSRLSLTMRTIVLPTKLFVILTGIPTTADMLFWGCRRQGAGATARSSGRRVQVGRPPHLYDRRPALTIGGDLRRNGRSHA